MPPQALTLALFLVEEGIKLEPSIAAELKALLEKTDPTPADWDALRAKVMAKSYADYVPASALPSTSAAAEPVAITVLPTPASAPAPATVDVEPAPAAASEPTVTAAPAVWTGQTTDPHAA